MRRGPVHVHVGAAPTLLEQAAFESQPPLPVAHSSMSTHVTLPPAYAAVSVSDGSHVWWYAARMQEWLEGVSGDTMAFYAATMPEADALRRPTHQPPRSQN